MPRFAFCDPAVIALALDPWFCVPIFQWVCPVFISNFNQTGNKMRILFPEESEKRPGAVEFARLKCHVGIYMYKM